MRPLSFVQAGALPGATMRMFLSILLLLLFVPPWTGAERLALYDHDAPLIARRIDAPRRMGALRLVGMMRLESGLPGFGGFSAVTLRQGRLTLLSDGGNWLNFAIRGGRVVDARIGYLPAGPGLGWEKEDRDSESLALDPATGQAWVGFETFNQIWRYDPRLARAQAHAGPAAMAKWGTNRGAEAMVRLRDGRFVVICERGAKRRIPREGLIFPGDPTSGAAPARFGFVPPAEYDVSDAAELPGGDLLVLTRRFELPFRFTAKLVRVKRADLRAGATVRGTVVATLGGGPYAENWEGVTAFTEQGRTMLWLVADSDTALLQHSALAKFVLAEPDTPNGPPASRRRAVRKDR
jgi:hypothetical protein